MRLVKDNVSIVISVIQLVIMLMVLTSKFQKLEDGQVQLAAQYAEIKRELKDLSSLDRRVSVLEVRVDILGAKK
jgi:hypothetical protein